MSLDQALAYHSTGLEEAGEGSSLCPGCGKGRLFFFLALAATVGLISMKRHRSRNAADGRD